MADPWEGIPVVRSRNDPRQDEREKAETRYRNVTGDTNPLARPVILPGEEGYAGGGQYVPEAGVVVRPWESVPVLTDSQIRAEEIAAQRIADGQALQSGGGALLQGVTSSFSDELAGLIAGAGQATGNAYRTLTGQPVEVTSADLRSAMTNQLRGEQERFAMERPVSNAVLQLAGGALTGGGAIGSGVRGAVTTGAAYGAGYGAGSAEGGFVDRLPETAAGGVVGGVLGGGAQVGINAAAPYVQRLAGIAVGPGAAARAATRRAGPEAGAATRFSQYATPEAFAERSRLQALGIQPSVIDVIGGTGERMVRSAAGPAGPGAELAVQNSIQRTANLKPEIMDVTRGLSPETRSLEQVRGGIADLRSNLASEQYAPAYAARVQITPEIASALSDAPGRAALDRARRAAVARRDEAQVQEIDGLINGALDEVSAGTLDRIRIALSGRAEDLSRRAGSRDIAGGIRSRASDVDAALGSVPEIAPARATYAELSGALDQLDNGAAVFTTNPQDFAAQVDSLTPTQREARILSTRERIMNMLGGQREAGTSGIQTVAEAPYSRQNLETLLGAEEAAQYLGSIQERVAQAQRAARVSPNTNSQTFGRGIDEQTFNTADAVGAVVDAGQSLTGNGFAIARTIDRIRARATLSNEERQAIVQLGLGSADELENIVAMAEAARSAGRPPPRAVRQFIERSRNTLGAQNPVAQQLEILLLPSRVSAEEEQQ